MCQCAEQIERATTKGHAGWAEYLATRCDRLHAEQTTTITPGAGLARVEAAAVVESEDA